MPERGASHDLVAGLPFLARLDEESRRALAAHARVQNAAPNAVIFRQGDQPDSLYVVADGELRVVVTAADGSEATIAVIGPCEACGELGLIDRQPRSATVVASGPVKLLAVNRADFVDWLRARPDAALALLETMSLRVRGVDETIADFAFLDLSRRLSKRLLSLSADGTNVIHATQSELASMLGVSRESVNKELKVLARHGSIRVGRGSVTVVDSAALAAMLSR